MKNIPDIKDNEIRIIGSSSGTARRLGSRWLVVAIIVASILLISAVVWFVFGAFDEGQEPAEIQFAKMSVTNPTTTPEQTLGYTEVEEQTVNDVPMYLYTPLANQVTLQVGLPDSTDNSIVFAAQAADVRADNGGIVSEFVDRGELLSKGVAKIGFCAILGEQITIGVGKQTPLLQQAIDDKGYFFRQYALVDNGQMIENAPKGKAIRRALVERRGGFSVVESRSAESFHDFAQALVDLECKNAIYLCGSTAYGWYRTENGAIKEFGVPNPRQPQMTSYIVWRK